MEAAACWKAEHRCAPKEERAAKLAPAPTAGGVGSRGQTRWGMVASSVRQDLPSWVWLDDGALMTFVRHPGVDMPFSAPWVLAPAPGWSPGCLTGRTSIGVTDRRRRLGYVRWSLGYRDGPLTGAGPPRMSDAASDDTLHRGHAYVPKRSSAGARSRSQGAGWSSERELRLLRVHAGKLRPDPCGERAIP